MPLAVRRALVVFATVGAFVALIVAVFPDAWQKAGLVTLSLFALIWPFAANEYWLTVANQGLVSCVGALALMLLTGFAGQISLGHAAFLAVGAYTVAILGKFFHVPFWLGIPMAGAAAAALQPVAAVLRTSLRDGILRRRFTLTPPDDAS